MYPLKTGSVGSLPSEMDRNLVAAASTAEAVAVATEAGEQQDPDNPIAAAVVSAAENATAIVATSVVSAAVISATEEQQQDNPDTAVTSIVVLCASTSAGIVTSAVGSSQITHFSASKMFVLWFIVCTPACQCFIQNACINSDMY